MKKIGLIAILTMMLSGCSGFVEDFNNRTAQIVSFPAAPGRTVSCLETASSLSNYMFEKERILPGGDVVRYNLRKPGKSPNMVLDISKSAGYTSIIVGYDRRDNEVITDLDKILGYCKREIG